MVFSLWKLGIRNSAQSRVRLRFSIWASRIARTHSTNTFSSRPTDISHTLLWFVQNTYFFPAFLSKQMSWGAYRGHDPVSQPRSLHAVKALPVSTLHFVATYYYIYFPEAVPCGSASLAYDIERSDNQSNKDSYLVSFLHAHPSLKSPSGKIKYQVGCIRHFVQGSCNVYETARNSKGCKTTRNPKG